MKSGYIKSAITAVFFVGLFHFLAGTSQATYRSYIGNNNQDVRNIFWKAGEKITGNLNADDISSPFITVLNKTLGFEKVVFVNLPKRYDYRDAFALQASYTGLDYIVEDAVDYHDLPEDMKGLPPYSSDKPPGKPHRACYRSHANALVRMLQENWSTMIVFESDATWDVNLKPSMQRLAGALHELIKENKLERLPDGTGPTREDPWDSQQWDYIALSACYENEIFSDIYLKYPDEDSPDFDYVYESNNINEPLIDERVIRKSGFPVCTSGYALTANGARKILMRGALDLNEPYDLIIGNMAHDETLRSFTPHPPLIYQWDYMDEIGMDQFNSDIDPKGDRKVSKEKWKQVHETRNVWRLNNMFRSRRFKHWIMDQMGKEILRGEGEG